MIPTYVPVFKAMKGELDAVAHITEAEAPKVHPLFDVTRIGPNTQKAKWFRHSATPTEEYVDRVVDGIAAVWSGRTAMIDAYHWAADAVVDSGEHVLPYIFNRLNSSGINVIPVVGYDRWDNQAYRLAMRGSELVEADYCCLRLDADAIEDAADPEFFLERIDSILEDLDLRPERCAVLIDFGDLTTHSLEEMGEKAEMILALLDSYGFLYLVTTGCSLPKSIDLAVKKPDSVGTVLRKEMVLWQMLRQAHPGIRLVYGDYGVRGPTSNEGVPNKHANAKIRHTIDKHFFVVRGHSMMLEGKGEQVWGLAETVVHSRHYLGEGFSWGDSEIAKCSRKEIKGGHTQWISIDTSHHVAFAVAEVEEFELAMGKAAATT